MDTERQYLDSLAAWAMGPGREDGADLRLLFEAAPLAIFLHDRRGRILAVNRRACSHLGYDRDTLLSLRVGDVNPDFGPDRLAQMADLLAGGDPMIFESRHRCADGTVLPVEVHICGFQSGGDLLLLSYVHDVSVRKQTEEALRQEHDFISAVLDTASALIIVLEENGRILSFNRACERATGFRAAEVVGRPVWDRLIPPEQIDAVRCVFESGDGKVPVREYENDWMTRTGDRRTIAWRNSWLPVVGSRIYGIGIGIDVTEQRQTEQALRDAKIAAENANRAKSEFLATVSHELRTPLNAILGFSEIIREKTFGPDALDRYADYAADIHASGLHLLDVVNDILDLSRVEAGRMQLDCESCRVDQLFAEAVHLLQDRAARRNLTLSTEIVGDAVEIRADRRSMRRVLFNLLSNAVKFTPSGGRITLRARRSAGRMEIAVSDTGIGIAAKDLSRIRAPFEQVRSCVDTTHEGTGLGLPLVDRLVRLHGGEVDIESTPMIGTTVRIQLPEERTADSRRAG
ncbi:MAG: PAS domain S-box protein [Alphaproteobacteria bacterium]|nr:PAS domain S-box protein [Alphaproteobacteria bacterium]